MISELNSNAPVDVHMADQIIPYLAFHGGKVLAPNFSNHARTNIHVVNQFGFKLKTKDNLIES
jgi:RNA 3'-terminal phosphate cyclase (ATP)